MNPSILYALALLVTILLGGGLARLWERRERRDAEKKWEERERLLDRRRPIANRREILRRRRLRPRQPAYLDRRLVRTRRRSRLAGRP